MAETLRGDRISKHEIENNDVARSLAGGHNEHFKLIERRCHVTLGLRGTTLNIAGDAPSVAFVERLLGTAHGHPEGRVTRSTRKTWIRPCACSAQDADARS